MNSSGNAIFIGSYNRDLTWYVNTCPTAGETTTGKFDTGHGGKGSNQAISAGKLHKLPYNVLFVGGVGDDAFGKDVLSSYKNYDFDSIIVKSEKYQTGNAAIIVENDGENRIIVAKNTANDFLSIEALSKEEIIKLNEKLQVENTYVAFQGELSYNGTKSFIDYIKKNASRAKILMNTAPFRPDYDWVFLLKNINILIVNEIECKQVYEKIYGIIEGTEHRMEKILKDFSNMEMGVVTLGSKGAYVIYKENKKLKEIIIPALKMEENEHVIDTSGAGDCFVGAFVSELSIGMSPENACKFAVTASGLSVTKKGTSKSVPNRKETLKRLVVTD